MCSHNSRDSTPGTGTQAIFTHRLVALLMSSLGLLSLYSVLCGHKAEHVSCCLSVSFFAGASSGRNSILLATHTLHKTIIAMADEPHTYNILGIAITAVFGFIGMLYNTKRDTEDGYIKNLQWCLELLACTFGILILTLGIFLIISSTATKFTGTGEAAGMKWVILLLILSFYLHGVIFYYPLSCDCPIDAKGLATDVDHHQHSIGPNNVSDITEYSNHSNCSNDLSLVVLNATMNICTTTDVNHRVGDTMEAVQAADLVLPGNITDDQTATIIADMEPGGRIPDLVDSSGVTTIEVI